MSKKVLALSLAIMLMAGIFVGCSNNQEPKEQTSTPETNQTTTPETTPETSTPEVVVGDLTDGTYLIKGEVTENGNFAMVLLNVSGGEVADFSFRQFLIDSGETKNHDNYPYEAAVDVVADLNKQFNEKKDLSAVDFDAVSGASHTKDDFKAMVGEVLVKASNGEAYTPVLKDGTYEAKATEPSFGWLAEVTVVVVDGQIVGLDYKELAIEASDGVQVGDRKTADNYPYARPVEIAKELQKLIIDNNGTDNLDVDGISGATETRGGMIDLVNQALSSAK